MPKNFDACSLLGQLYVSQKRLEEAAARGDRLAVWESGAVGPQTMAALIVEAQGEQRNARQRCERIVEAGLRAAVTSNNFAWRYASRGEQLDRALHLAQTAKVERPDVPAVNGTLACVNIEKQLSSIAVSTMLLAVSKDPCNPVFHHRLGLALAQDGNKTAARQVLKRALTLKGDFEGVDEAWKLAGSL